VSFLLDTNVLSELRKGGRANQNVRSWFQAHRGQAHYTSVLVLGEIRRGIEQKRRRDPESAAALEAWLKELEVRFSERVLPVDAATAQCWGRLNVPDPLPAIDGLLAATALTRGLKLVTRNERDVRRAGVEVVNPFAGP